MRSSDGALIDPWEFFCFTIDPLAKVWTLFDNQVSPERDRVRESETSA